MPECDSDAAPQRTLQESQRINVRHHVGNKNQHNALPPMYLQYIFPKEKKKSLTLTPDPLKQKTTFS